VVLLQDDPEMDGGEGPPHAQLHDELAVQPAEDARADAGDKDDPELLQVRVAVEGPGQHLLRGDKGSRETAGRSSISLIRVEGASRIFWDGEGGAKVRHVSYVDF